MSNVTTAASNNNPLLIDQYGSYIGLLRKRDEDIESFKNRVVRAYKDLYELDNESFFRSLGYITAEQEYQVFELTLENVDLKNCSVSSDIEKTVLNIEGSEYTIHYKDNKFMIDLYNTLDSIDNVKLTLLTDKADWHFLHCKNIKNVRSDRLLLNQFIENYIVELPRDNIVDFNFYLNEEFDYQIDNNVLLRSEPGFKKGYFSFKKFPLTFTWTPFSACACNSVEFENLLKDSNGILTQRGARIINKILEKQNTYWGG